MRSRQDSICTMRSRQDSICTRRLMGDSRVYINVYTRRSKRLQNVSEDRVCTMRSRRLMGDSRVYINVYTRRSKRLQNVSEDLLTISRKRSKTSVNDDGSEYSLPIPMDLLVEIFSKLPVTTIPTCRYVSKYWAYVLAHPDFTESFLTKSSARPQILLACANNNGISFFSSHQPQNPEDNSSPVVPAYPLTHVPGSCDISRPVNGMVCLRGERILKGRRRPVDVSVIYNPTSGEFLTLPETKTKTRNVCFRWKSYLGYDPIKKQYKVLSMACPPSEKKNDDPFKKQHNFFSMGPKCVEFQVLTLGTGKLSWKMIECCISHRLPKPHSEICINGVLYYRAVVRDDSGTSMSVVSFDFISEKFSVLKFMESFTMPDTTTLINYNGKLGLLMTEEFESVVSKRCRSFELWILRDAEKREWSKRIYALPALWNNVGSEALRFAGMIGTKEIVLLSCEPYDHPYVFYYNIERETIRRFEIQRTEGFKVCSFHIFLNHVETVKPIQA